MFSLPNWNLNIWCDGAYFKLLEIAETRAMGTSSFDCNEYKECLLRVQTTQQARSLIWTTSTLAASMWETSHILSWCCTRIHQHRDATYAWNPLNAWSISPTTLLIFTLNIGFRGDTSLRTSYLFDSSTGNNVSPPFANVFFHIRIREDKQGWVVRAKDPSKNLIGLGVRFTPFDKTIRDTVGCLRSKWFII